MQTLMHLAGIGCLCSIGATSAATFRAAYQERAKMLAALLGQNRFPAASGAPHVPATLLQFRRADHAVSDPTSAPFRDGLAMDGMYTGLLWSANEDLVRIDEGIPSEKVA